MTELELVQAIKDWIVEIYEAEYVGYIVVEKSSPIYKLILGIPSYMFPTYIMGSFDTDEEFLNYVYEELKIRNYMRVYFYKVERTSHTTEK